MSASYSRSFAWFAPFAVAVLMGAAPMAAQSKGAGQSGPRKLLPRAEEIALARSAAPAAVSKNATVWVLTDSGLRRGGAGDQRRRLLRQPKLDRERRAALLRRRRARRRSCRWRCGRSSSGTAACRGEDVEREIAAGLSSGRFRTPRRPVLSWMLSGAQQLISDDGKPVGKWRPHLMIYYPYLTAAELGLGAVPDLKGAVLVDGGTPTSNLMIVTSDFVQPERPASAAR